MADLFLVLSEHPCSAEQTQFHAALVVFALHSGGSAYIAGTISAHDINGNALVQALSPSTADSVSLIRTQYESDLVQRLGHQADESSPNAIIFFKCGVAYPEPDQNRLESWLTMAVSQTGHCITSAPLCDTIAGIQLHGFSLSDSELHPSWRMQSLASKLDAVALPLLVAKGKATNVLPYAVVSAWPHGYCALLMSMFAQTTGIELRCQAGMELGITPLPISHRGLDGSSPAVALTCERLIAWRSMWGYEVMMIEAARLAITNASETGVALEEANRYSLHSEGISPMTLNELKALIH